MIAGGFAQAYTFKDPLADLRRSQEQPAFVGSETTDAKFDIRSGLGSGGGDFEDLTGVAGGVILESALLSCTGVFFTFGFCFFYCCELANLQWVDPYQKV